MQGARKSKKRLETGKRRLVMRALVLSAAGVLFCALPALPAAASVLTLGGPLSFNCYKSAESADFRQSSIDGCTRALQEEGLDVRDTAATLVNRGILYAMQNHYDAADADYSKAGQLAPNLAEIWLNKAYLKLRENKPSEALSLLDRGMKLGAQRPAVAYLARGLAHEQLGELRAAYSDLTRARELEPAWNLPGEYLARYEVRSR
jgi:tetratricopeptide (TPR) repeat protein